MAILPRKLLKLFAGDATPTGNIAQFGSLAAAAPAYSDDPDVIQALDAWLEGWDSATVGNESPALEDFNGLLFVLAYMIKAGQQQGIPEWIATEEYDIGSFCKVDGVLYRALTANTNKDPETETNDWENYAEAVTAGPGTCKAWVCFNGVTGAIYSSHNVTSITKLAVGYYLINFTAPMANADYAWAGSCGTPNGSAPIAGDNNNLAGGSPGKATVKTVNQLSVFAVEAATGALEDSQAISVQIFGTS